VAATPSASLVLPRCPSLPLHASHRATVTTTDSGDHNLRRLCRLPVDDDKRSAEPAHRVFTLGYIAPAMTRAWLGPEVLQPTAGSFIGPASPATVLGTEVGTEAAHAAGPDKAPSSTAWFLLG
jgi:hypothetical protein